jgi:hypothetical protein
VPKVSRKLPVGTAVGVARELFASRARHDVPPSQHEFIDAVRKFERIEFDVPADQDADGFLFYWGPVNWFPEPTFTLGVIRQLGIADSAGEHEAHIQVVMEYLYAIDPDLESLGSPSSWWFRWSDDVFSTWLDSVQSDPVWQAMADKPVRAFVISTDEVC